MPPEESPTPDPTVPTQPPSLGRNVHYVLPDGPNKGHHRAAIITGVHGRSCVNLTVFLDQHADDTRSGDFIATRRAWSCNYSANSEPGTWHYPEPVKPPVSGN